MSSEVIDASYDQATFADRVFRQRYALPGEDWATACRRVAAWVAMAEEPGDRQRWEEDFYRILHDRLFCPGGRIWHGAARPPGQLLNCFVLPIDDTLPAWLKAHTETALVSAAHGGVGLNFSRIRAAGTKSTHGQAGGPLMAMRMINHTVSLLEQTGGRRGALMFCLDRDHADVGEFLDFKAKDGDIAHANISVNYNTSVREWLRNKDQVFEQIVERACQNGEPGILNGHLANEENNIWYYRKLISTNPCGEIWLEPYGCCCLGHLVLLNLMSNKAEGYSWDHEKLRQTIYLAVRFLDNVLTVSQYPLPELAENCQKVRRIGLGVTGLAHALILRDLEYTKSVDEVRGLMREIMDDAYGASISLAMEKGPFQRFDKKLLASGFAQRLPAHTRKAIEERGLRNCAILTVAPTGTISTMLDVSPGIEPIMGRSYSRIWRDGDQWTRVQCRDPFWDEHMNTNEPEPVDNSPLFRTATEMRIEDHLAMQTTVQEFVDNAVSKTVNIPQGLMPGEVAERIAYYLPYLKGLTLFPAGSREASPFEEDPTCPTGACEV